MLLNRQAVASWTLDYPKQDHKHCVSNGMLRHSFLRVGEDISLQHFIVPSFTFLLCLAVYLVHFIACLQARAKQGMAIRARENKIDRQTEEKGKGGNKKYRRAELDLRSTK